MAVRWTYFAGTTDEDDGADSLLARLDLNDARGTTGIVPNGIIIDDAVTDATVTGGTVTKETSTDDTPSNGTQPFIVKIRTLKKGKKSRF